ncbi:MAG: hypothetical protein IKQ93_04370 [Candidatus Methanomethylophilaceae archaeon]|nr:hypothetical protein [Candidatus Methanomethylophilaceae archaeon]MBR6911368.1 hypothetical protein [Candidatus Methanomethylophilaceae archaeon]
MSPEDVLNIYGTMKIVEGDADIRQIAPKDVRELDAQLRMFLYSTEIDLDKLIKDKEKRARKKKS